MQFCKRYDTCIMYHVSFEELHAVTRLQLLLRISRGLAIVHSQMLLLLNTCKHSMGCVGRGIQ